MNEAEEEEPEESIDDEHIDVAEVIITEWAEKAESQEADEHTDVSTPTDIEPVIDDDTVGLEETIESGEETHDIPDDIETEKETNETEVQGP